MAFKGKDDRAQNIEQTEVLWLNNSHGSALPYRGDFEALNDDYQFLVERDELGNLRVRHAGLFVEALFGASLAGRSFDSLFSEPHRVLFQSEMKALFEEPAKIFLTSLTPDGEVDLALFPVSADYGPVDFALGAINLEAVPEHNVTTLGVRTVEKISLRAAKEELRYGFAEDRAGFGGAPRSPFQVIQGGGATKMTARPGLKVIQNVKREP